MATKGVSKGSARQSKKTNKKNSKSITGKSNSNSNGSLNFVPIKKSKKAKNKKKKDDLNKEKNLYDDKKRTRENGSDKLKNSSLDPDNNDNDNDTIDSEDEFVDISSASISSSDDHDDDESSNSDGTAGKNDKDIILLDSDSDPDGIINTDGDAQPPLKKRKTESKSNMDDDYIAFDFSSDEEISKDENVENSLYDDNEYLSNDEGSYHSKNINHKVGEANDEFPWIRNSDHSKEREMSDWLTSEIKDFVRYISPSAEEIKSRNKVIENLKEHIKSIWPDAELHCFGSFATDLYLPGSDIDCVVVSKRGRYDNKSSLYQLTSYIRNHKLGIEVTPIAKAKVPIIKFVDPTTKIHIDISFERSNGLTAAKLIIDWLANTPGLRELVLVVKQFLSVRKLNEVHVGGLGGFSIICLVYSFLKLHPRLSTNNIDPLENLGCLLIEFFELYGYNFGYDEVALAFTSDKQPIYVTKNSNSDLMGRNPFSLAIQDPYDSSNNISRGSFNLRDIKRAFGGAFELLANKCYEMQSATYKQRLGKSILGGIIKYKGKQRDFHDAREHVKNVAYHAASVKKPTKKSSGVLPPLPSEKAGIDVDDYYMSDSFYSDSELEVEQKKNSKKLKGNNTDKNETKKYEDIFNSSQKPNLKRTTSQNPEQLLGIRDANSEDDNYTPDVNTERKEPDFTDSGSDYDPLEAINDSKKVVSAVSSLAKKEKREYWSQKSGNIF